MNILDNIASSVLANNPPITLARWQTRGNKHWLELYTGYNEHGQYWSYRGNGCGGCLGGTNNGMSQELAFVAIEKKVWEAHYYDSINMKRIS
jgi:hypothetical protein